MGYPVVRPNKNSESTVGGSRTLNPDGRQPLKLMRMPIPPRRYALLFDVLQSGWQESNLRYRTPSPVC